MRTTSSARTALATLGLTILLAAFAGAGESDELENLARELVQRRTEVERLSSQVELEKTELREGLRGTAQQRADLERQVHALEQELTGLRAQAASQVAAVESRQAARAALTPLVVEQLDALAAHVSRGLPFRSGERVAELTRLRTELTSGKLAPPEALGRLWSACEDELRLCRENGLYRQQLELDGQTQLCDVARLGMVLLYFRTLDGRLGLLVPAGDGWRCEVADDRATQGRIAALFEALEKHIRQGWFLLPNPYAGETPAAEASPR